MARPRQFDPEQALDAAMAVFWRQGYHASSLQQLLDAMGLNRGSLYATFGDKAALFRQVMDRYQHRLQALVLALLDNSDDPVAGIRQAFELSLLSLPAPQRQLGCLLVNTVNELTPLDESLAARAATHLALAQVAFVRACQRAREHGRLNATVSAEAAGQLLMTTMTGLRVQARRGASADELRQGIAPLMTLLFTEH